MSVCLAFKVGSITHVTPTWVSWCVHVTWFTWTHMYSGIKLCHTALGSYLCFYIVCFYLTLTSKRPGKHLGNALSLQVLYPCNGKIMKFTFALRPSPTKIGPYCFCYLQLIDCCFFSDVHLFYVSGCSYVFIVPSFVSPRSWCSSPRSVCQWGKLVPSSRDIAFGSDVLSVWWQECSNVVLQSWISEGSLPSSLSGNQDPVSSCCKCNKECLRVLSVPVWQWWSHIGGVLQCASWPTRYACVLST